ncbi:hypothetical protein R6Z07F_002651 [Ovis aries]
MHKRAEPGPFLGQEVAILTAGSSCKEGGARYQLPSSLVAKAPEVLSRAPETSGKAYSEAARPRHAGQQPPPRLPRPQSSQTRSSPVPGSRGRPRGPYHEPLPGRRPGCSGLPPPPPGVLPASSSAARRCRLRETRVPKSRSRRLQPAFQAAPNPPLPLLASSHFRPVPAELAEVRSAGNGRTQALASLGSGGGGGARAEGAERGLQRLRRPRPKSLGGLGPPQRGSPGSAGGGAGDCGSRRWRRSVGLPLSALRPASYQCPNSFRKTSPGGAEEPKLSAGPGTRSDSRASAIELQI